MSGKITRTVMAPASVPALARHVKMRHDSVRNRWLILAPERVFTPDSVAVAVLQLCDGKRSVETIAVALAQTYNAPEERILRDILPMLQDLADRGVVTA
ncbi:MAG TPA: pyrroloquinoline quinone biosynthesis peptide chaperone PqqD [Hyphomicrobiaceae bacterium]|nr:pyrroloquinoline quinone biosynthesis peptide chaperone PqqD [Hyphomicrobiaceae bacterium]